MAINASTLANWYRTVIEYSSLNDFTYHYSTLPFHYFEWFEESPVATEEYVESVENYVNSIEFRKAKYCVKRQYFLKIVKESFESLSSSDSRFSK